MLLQGITASDEVRDLGVKQSADCFIKRLFERVSGFQPHRSAQTIVVDPDTAFDVRLHAGGFAPSEPVGD